MTYKQEILNILAEELGATIIDTINNAGYVLYSSEADTLCICENQEEAEAGMFLEEHDVYIDCIGINELDEYLTEANIPHYVS